MKTGKKSAPILSYIFIAVVLFVYLFPLFYLLNTSLKGDLDYLKNPASITTAIHFSNYAIAWKSGNFGAYVLNSLFYTVMVVVISVLMAVLVSFPIARGYLKKSGAWYAFFMIGMFLPNGLIPFFQLMLKLHLYNTPWSFILNNLSFNFIFMMFTGYIKSIPADLDQAASIDGCGYIRYLFSFILPLMKPAIATGVIIVAIGVWNNIISAVIFFSDKRLYPVVLGLFRFYGQYTNNNTVLSAAVIIVALPLVFLYAFLQKYIVQGVTSGAVKG